MSRLRFYCPPFLLSILSLAIVNHVSSRILLVEGSLQIFKGSSTMAFAGFGASKTKAVSKKKKPPKEISDLSTAEGRMALISSRIQKIDLSPMTTYKGGELDPNFIFCVDNFLGGPFIDALRAEAESLIPTMVPSQSTRWDDETQSVISYQKDGVLSTQIEGGAQGYQATPRLVEYVVTLTQNLAERINALVPSDFHLSGTQQTNKLAVCLGGGSKYDKHIDNLGGSDGIGDMRKMTALLYLQPSGSHSDDADHGETDPRGGYFRAYDVPEIGKMKVFAPRGDRLLLFWSDSLVHDVSPSFAPNSEIDRRWALTVWFVVKNGGKIRKTDADVEKRHFGRG